MALKNRMKTEPIPVVRQHRPVRVRDFTTAKPGKIEPVAAFGLLRGDSCSGRLNIAIEMNETWEVLYNRVMARLSVVFIPATANERFQRNMAFFERSAVGEPSTNEEGAEVIPFIETHAFTQPPIPIYRTLGVTYKAGTMISTAYLEGYNQWVNYAYRQRSASLPQRELDDTSLAPAMWGASSISEIVPNFDSAMIAGEIPLTLAGGKFPIRAETLDGSAPITPLKSKTRADGTADKANIVLTNDAGVGAYELYTQLSADGVSVQLANIDQARKLVDWAKVRESYEGHKDPFIIENLMAGIEVESQQWFHPMLIDQKTVDVKQLKRMATNAPDLTEGVANGVAVVSVGCNVPMNMYGGVVMVFMEVLPEQLFERQADPYLTITDIDDLPRYDRDVLNPMPVVEVLNKEVDAFHDTPAGRFGYARRNWQWASIPARVGGEMQAANPDSVSETDRRVIWPTEKKNPTLSTEFYLSTTLGREIFVDEIKDPLKVGVGGVLDVIGLTIIGEVHESEANYDAVRAEYPPLQMPS